MGMTLMVGSCSVLLTFFWLRICRLRSLIRRRDQRIKRLLAVDALTSLSNRETLFQTGKQLLLTFPDADVALLSINIHQFRAVNEEFGHAVGDELLQQIARRLQTCIGPQDTLARVGNDQFSLLLSPYYDAPNTGGADAFGGRAKTLASRILSVLHQPFYVQSHTVWMEASMGIAIAKRWMPNLARESTKPSMNERSVLSEQRSFGRLLSQSRVALSHAQKAPTHPGNAASHRYAFFVPEMEARRSHQAQMRRDLAQAIERQELRIRYQPIVSLKTQQTVGFEALVRWQHPSLGLLSPDRFLPLAEEMGLIVEIDRWVLEAACQQLVKWRAEQLYPSLSVNLSGVQLSRPDVAAFVRSLLSRYAVSPSQLNLEVTESVMIAEPIQAIDTLRQLKEMGLRLSLDDFGTGYSSLEYLHQFPVDVLKIDKSFISTMGSPSPIVANNESQTNDLQTNDLQTNQTPEPQQSQSPTQIIVRSILSLAQGLGLEVVAEGIEYDNQCAQLRHMQCTYGQGNFFDAPMTGLAAGVRLKQNVA